MIAQVQGVLSKTMGNFSSSAPSIKALVGSHPVAVGVVLGIGAYYAINKYWLDKDEGQAEELAQTAEKPDEGEVTA